MKKLILIASLLVSTSAVAQQQPDPSFMQKAINQLSAQRNQALDALAGAETRLQIANEELTKAQARIKELEEKEKKPEPPKK